MVYGAASSQRLLLRDQIVSQNDFTIKGIHRRSQVFYKKTVLINFTKFKGKHFYRTLFLDKVVGLKFKKRLLHRSHTDGGHRLQP